MFSYLHNCSWLVKKRNYFGFFLFFIILWGCHKTEKKTSALLDDFESLSGKGTASWNYVQTKVDLEHLRFFSDIYERKKNLLKTSSSDFRIPPIVHFIWIGPHAFPRESVENVRTWMGKHPTWTFYFWSDRQRPTPCPGMHLRLIQHLNWHSLKNCFNTSDNFGEKSDLLRYEILFQEGGIYVDHDVKCLQSFELLNKTYDFYCGIDMPYTSSLPSCVFTTNNLIGIKPQHPILKNCFKKLSEQWEQIGQDYPGSDRDAMLNRTLHRTFLQFGEAVKQSQNIEDNHDIIFPAYFFDAPQDHLAIYARHLYAGKWHESQTSFEKKVSERLMYLSKKSNKILLAIAIMMSVNVFLFAWGFWKLSTYQKSI